MRAQPSPLPGTALLLAAFFGFAAGCRAQIEGAGPLKVEELLDMGGSARNVCVVTPNLIRGGQPTAEGVSRLKHAGIRTIIDLRNEPAIIEREANVCRQLGVRFVSIPLDEFNVPASADSGRFLQAVNDPGNQPVYVHCLHGQDRTGAMVGLYRVMSQGWTADQAYEEMVARGFHPVFVNLARVVFDGAAQLGRPSARPDRQTELMVEAVKQRLGRFLGR